MTGVVEQETHQQLSSRRMDFFCRATKEERPRNKIVVIISLTEQQAVEITCCAAVSIFSMDDTGTPDQWPRDIWMSLVTLMDVGCVLCQALYICSTGLQYRAACGLGCISAPQPHLMVHTPPCTVQRSAPPTQHCMRTHPPPPLVGGRVQDALASALLATCVARMLGRRTPALRAWRTRQPLLTTHRHPGTHTCQDAVGSGLHVPHAARRSA